MESTLACPLRKTVRGPELSQQKGGTTPENAPSHGTAHGGAVWWKNTSWKKVRPVDPLRPRAHTHTRVSGLSSHVNCQLFPV